MLKKILPLMFPLLALIGGIAAGDLLAPGPDKDAAAEHAVEGEGETGEAAPGHGEGDAEAADAGSVDAGSGDAGGGEHGEGDAGTEHAGSGDHGAADTGSADDGEGEGEGENPEAWFTFPNQFFVPLVRGGDIDGMMVLTLTIETSHADLQTIEKMEFLLRDALLRVLIIHANTGGFTGNYTTEAKLGPLREALNVAAIKAGGSKVHGVLIGDVALAGI